MAVMVGIRLEGLLERPETALSGSPWLRLLPVFAPEQTPRTSPNTDWIGCGDRPYQNAKELA